MEEKNENPVVETTEQKDVPQETGKLKAKKPKNLGKVNEINPIDIHMMIETMFKDAGLKSSGLSPNGNLVEIVEVENHPWFLAGQFHPEFKSSPMEPHPLFRDFIASSIDHRRDKHSGSSKYK